MYKTLFISFILSFLLSCNGKSQETGSNTAEVIEEKIEVEKPKSKYEISQALKKYFKRVQRKNVTQVLPEKVSPDDDGIYCYFLERGNRVISLNLHIKYSAYDAVSYELTVGADSKTYEVNKKIHSNMNGLIVESSTLQWYDKMINEEDEALIRKIGEAGKASLKLFGADGALLATIELSKDECKSLVNTVDYYISLNGAKIPKKGMVNVRSFNY